MVLFIQTMGPTLAATDTLDSYWNDGNLPASDSDLLATKVLGNQLQSRLQVPVSRHLRFMLLVIVVTYKCRRQTNFNLFVEEKRVATV